MIGRPIARGDRGFRSAGRRRLWGALLGVVPIALLASGCSVERLVVKRVASSLGEGTDVFARDDDPELVREALPFSLKLVEMLLAEAPEDENLLLAAASGFTQYAYAFVELDAELLEFRDRASADRLRARALNLYLRARDYGLRGLEGRAPGISEALYREPEAAVAAAGREAVPLLYWTGAAWGSAVSLGLDRPELVADLGAVRALLERALELDPDYGNGAVHEAMISLAALPEGMGGSPRRARHHFERAVELSGGRAASPYVTLARQVAVPAQDAAEFRALLRRALAVDPDAAPEARLANLLAQRRARHLLEHIEDYFLEIDEPREMTAP